jgi:hypothetical protein
MPKTLLLQLHQPKTGATQLQTAILLLRGQAQNRPNGKHGLTASAALKLQTELREAAL